MDYLRGTDAAPVSFAEQPENLDLDYISSLLHEPFGESSDTVATKAEAKNPQALEDYVNRALAAQNKYIDKSVNAQSKFVDRGVEGVNRYVDNVDERAAAINQAWDDYVNKSLNAQGGYADKGAGAMNGAVDQYAELFKGQSPEPNTKGEGELIDGIKITDGKVGGKIPVDEFKTIRQASIKNPESTTLTLGKFTPTVENGVEDWSKPGPDSYIAKAGKSSYFDLGSEYRVIQKKYGLKDSEMFDYFNRPALDEAISKNKSIRYSHNPLDYEKGAIVDEWEYIKSALGKIDSDLIKIGGYWYVK